jgi:hypothetical protein
VGERAELLDLERIDVAHGTILERKTPPKRGLSSYSEL